MLKRLLENFTKFAALGAMGVAGGAFAAYAGMIWLFSPTPKPGMPGSGGGIDHVLWYTLIVAVFVPIALLAAWHVDFGKQLKDGPKSIVG